MTGTLGSSNQQPRPVRPSASGTSAQSYSRAQAAAFRPVGVMRLTRLQLRASWSTRVGKWLYAITLAMSAVVAVATNVFGPDSQQDLMATLTTTTLVVVTILPIVTLLLFTTEWGTRTTMTTFVLTPQRWRVVASKLVATAVISIMAFTLAAILAAGALAIAGDGADMWAIEWQTVGQLALYVAALNFISAAFGAAFLNTPLAIVAFFVAPVVTTFLALWPTVADQLQWIDQTATIGQLGMGDIAGEDWTRFAVGMLIWMLIPLAVGWRRIVRQDIA